MFSERHIAGVEVIYVGQHAGQVLDIERHRLLPLDLPDGETQSAGLPPLVNLGPRKLFEDIIGEYFFAVLEKAAMQSFFGENSARFRTMEAAHQNIRKKSAELTRIARRIRQDAVTARFWS
jgi:F0F1-type ATP synthase gamma subunit